MGGKTVKLIPVYCCRANVLFVVNLTHASGVVQVVSVQIREIYPGPPYRSVAYTTTNLKLSCQNTEFTPQFSRDFNGAFALTPLRSAIIISVSVRSAELRLVLYV